MARSNIEELVHWTTEATKNNKVQWDDGERDAILELLDDIREEEGI